MRATAIDGPTRVGRRTFGGRREARDPSAPGPRPVLWGLVNAAPVHKLCRSWVFGDEALGLVERGLSPMHAKTNGRARIGVFAAVAGALWLGCCADRADAGITLTYDFVDESGDLLAVMHLSQTTNGIYNLGDIIDVNLTPTGMSMFGASSSAIGLLSQSGGSISAQGNLLVADPAGGSTDFQASSIPNSTPITHIVFDSSDPPRQSALQWFPSETPAFVHGDWQLVSSTTATPEPASLAIWSVVGLISAVVNRLRRPS